jgi:exodeoxyribonuclease VII large subunit
VETLRLRMIRQRRRETERLRQRVLELAERLRDPKRRLADIRIALDDATERMRISLDHVREVYRQKCITMAVRLEHRDPRSRIAEWRLFMETLTKDLRMAWARQTGQRSNRLASAMALIDSLSPLAVLNRGYSIARRLPDGRIVRRAGDVQAGERIDVRLAAGSLHAVITETFKEQCDG